MIGKCEGFIDGVTIKLTDVDLAIIACNGGNGGQNRLSPGKVLVRHQIMEALVRLANDKFLAKAKPGTVATFKEAVVKAFEEHFLPHFKTFQCHEWRVERLWKEEIDIVYTRFLEKAQMIYAKHSGKFVAPGAKPTMSAEEFVGMLEAASLLNENFANREALPLWNLSMMTNKEETASEKHLNMTFVEFLEALARVADRMELENLEDHFPEYKGRSAFQLDKKIECLLFRLIQTTLGEKAYRQQMTAYRQKVAIELQAEEEGLEVAFGKN